MIVDVVTARRPGRPPVTTVAPNALAAYMRAYRAWKMGRGPKPAGRAQFCRDFAGDMAELEAEAYGAWDHEDAGRAWAELRDAVLFEGGIAPDADYSHRSMPRPVYRLDGKPADEMPLLLEARGFYFEGADDMLGELIRRYENWLDAERGAKRAA